MKRLALLLVLLFAAPAFAQFDFPNSPTANQIISGPAGQAMKWDGTKWVAQFGAVGGPFVPEAPLDGNSYLRTNGAWTSGGTLANDLTGSAVHLTNLSGWAPLNFGQPSLAAGTDGAVTASLFAYNKGVGGNNNLNITAGAHMWGGNWNADTPTAEAIVMNPTSISLQYSIGNTVGAILGTWNSIAVFNQQGLTIAGAATEANPLPYSLAVGVPIPSDVDRSQVLSAGSYNPTGAYSVWDAGIYVTSAGFKVGDPNGNAFHVYENAPATGGHEIGWDMWHGLTPGTILTAGANQYMALRDDANGGTPGLFLTNGSLWLGGKNMFQTGTWTPTFQCAGGNPTTDGGASGQWVAVGNMVWFSGHMGWNSVTSAGSGQGQVGGLPFPAIDSPGNNGILISDILIDNASSTSGDQTWRMVASIFNGDSYFRVYQTNFGSAGYLYPLPCENTFANSPSNARFNGWYRYQ